MIEDDVVVDMDADEEEGGSQFEVDTCGEGCSLHGDPMRMKGGASGLHRSCSGPALGLSRSHPAASASKGMAQGHPASTHCLLVSCNVASAPA